MEIDSTSSKYSIVEDRNTTRYGELTVMNVEYEDRGVYTCTATNSIGSVMESANLTVQGKYVYTMQLVAWLERAVDHIY